MCVTIRDNTGPWLGGGAGIMGGIVGHGGLVCLCTVRGTAGHSMYTGWKPLGTVGRSVCTLGGILMHLAAAYHGG